MRYPVDSCPVLEADAFVRGEGRRRISLREFRGTWVVLALGAEHPDVLGLAALDEAFAADGAVVVAATTAVHEEVERTYAGAPVRFPILSAVGDEMKQTVIVDPEGVVRYAGEQQSARETLAVLEELIYAPVELSRAA
jgi:peroxiredoxin